MSRPVPFDAQSKRGLFERCAQIERPQIVRIVPTDAVADAAPIIELYTEKDTLVLARTQVWTGTDALLWAAIVETGTIEVVSLPKPIDGQRVDFAEAYGEADLAARAYVDLVAPLGGIGAVLTTRSERLAEMIGNIPDAANAVLKYVDGDTSVAGITRQAGYACALTARILRRLGDMGVVERHDPLLPAPSQPAAPASAWSPPERGWGDASALPNEDEDATDQGLGEWMAEEPAPPPLLSDDAFSSAYAASDPRAQAPGEPPPAAPRTTPPRAEAHASITKEIVSDASEAPTPPPVAAASPLASPPSPAYPDDPAPLEGQAPEPSAPPMRSDSSARVRAKVPITTRRPGPADEDEAVLREAGVGGGSNSSIWLVGAVALVVIGAVIWGMRSDEPPAIPPPPPPPPLVVSTTTTSSVATATVAESSDATRATIAAPDAPEDVKRAERLLDAGRYREAGRLLDQLRDSRPDDASVFVLSGQVYVDTGRLGPARDMADRALAIDARSYRAWVLKGSAEQFLGRNENAIRAYERARELGPNHPMAPEIDSVIEQLRRRVR